MAQDLEKLVVQLSAEFRDFQKGMAQASGIANKEFRKVEQYARQMNRNLDNIGRSAARSLVAPFMGISAVLGGRELIRMTGVWTDLNSRLANSVGADRAASTMERLSEMARRTYSSIEQTTEGFLSFSTTLTELGYSTNQQLDFVESLNNALVVSGARGDVAARVMEALSRAMALGTLQGQNLNTVVSSGGRVAQALAESMGVTTMELRRLGQEGRIGRREMMGITTQLAQLREEAGRMPGTIQDGFLLLNNALLEYIGRGDEAVGVSARIAAALEMIADNFDTVADAGLRLAGIIAGALIGRSLVGLWRTVGTGTVALVTLTRTLNQVRTASQALAAFGGMGAAAGPAAMVIGGVLVASLMAFSRATDDSGTAAGRFRERMRAIAEGAEAAAAATEGAFQRMRNATSQQAGELLLELEDEAEAGAQAVARLTSELDATLSSLIALASQGIVSREQAAELEELRNALRRGTLSSDLLNASLDALRSGGDFGGLLGNIREIGAELFTAWRAAAGLNQEVTRTRQVAGVGLTDEQVGRLRDTVGQFWEGARNRRGAAAFLAEQTRLASRTREQIALERELESVQTAARQAGITLTQQQAEAQARANLAAQEAANPSRTRGGGGRGRQDQYTREVEQLRQAIAALEAEANAINGVELSLGGYADAAEYAQRRFELMQAAQQQGLTITPQLQAEIDALAQSYINAGNAVDQARERHEQFQRAVEDVRGTMEQAFTGLITGAHSFKDALRMVIARLAEMAASRAFQQLWDGAGGLGSGKGMGGGIAGFLRRMLGFAEGGPTPAGPKHKPVGIVHAGENVWSQEDVRRAGGMGIVEALRRSGGRAPGFATGGHMGNLVPRTPAMARHGDPKVVYVPVPQIVGVSADDDGKIVARMRAEASSAATRGMTQVRREIPGIMQDHQMRNG